MIVLLGSSYTRGAWGNHMSHPAALVHTLLANKLGCDVFNMSIPGNGSESFVDAYIYACKTYKPKLFLAELVEDRSRNMMYLPNNTTVGISEKDADYIYDKCFQYGFAGQEYNENCMDEYRIHNGAYGPAELQMLNDCHVQGHGCTLPQLLSWFNVLKAFHNDASLESIRTVKNFVSLEELSNLVGVPILYYRYNDSLEHEQKLSSKFGDRYMNKWHNLEVGTCEWAGTQLQGRHLADHTHLTKTADELVVSQLIAPFITAYAAAHGISLSK